MNNAEFKVFMVLTSWWVLAPFAIVSCGLPVVLVYLALSDTFDRRENMSQSQRQQPPKQQQCWRETSDAK